MSDNPADDIKDKVDDVTDKVDEVIPDPVEKSAADPLPEGKPPWANELIETVKGLEEKVEGLVTGNDPVNPPADPTPEPDESPSKPPWTHRGFGH